MSSSRRTRAKRVRSPTPWMMTKISRVLVAARLRVAKQEDSKSEEVAALTKLIGLYGAEADAKKSAKDAQAELGPKVLAKYAKLTTEDIQSLVIDDKWSAHFVRGAQAEIEVLVRRFVNRLNVLGNRYSETLDDLDAEVEILNTRVADHLAAMGFGK